MSQHLLGEIFFDNSGYTPTALIDGNAGSITAGATGTDGKIIVKAKNGQSLVTIDGSKKGEIIVANPLSGSGSPSLRFDPQHAALYIGDQSNEGDLIIKDDADRNVIQADAGSATVRTGITGKSGGLMVRDKNNRPVFNFNGEYAALYIGDQDNEGDIFVRDASGKNVFHFDAGSAGLTLGNENNEADLIMKDNENREVIRADAQSATLRTGITGKSGNLMVRDKNNRSVLNFNGEYAALYIGDQDNEGDLIVKDGSGRQVFHFNGEHAALYIGALGNEGDIFVRDVNGNDRIHLDGDTGDIKLQGADCAEEFDADDLGKSAPGTVLVIGDSGLLQACTIGYDRRAAGVVSGAGGHQPGLILDKNASGSPRYPVALCGKVFCKVDADITPVKPGDLLTTSATPGHAMKAEDLSQAFGAVIGKALAPLDSGKGLIPVLIALQ